MSRLIKNIVSRIISDSYATIALLLTALRVCRFSPRRLRSQKLIEIRFHHAVVDLAVLVRLFADVALRVLVCGNNIF